MINRLYFSSDSTASGSSLQDLQPTIQLRQINMGIQVKWSRQDNPQLYIDIYVDRGFGWEYLATDTLPDYIDTRTSDRPVTWKYKAIYRHKDEQIGHWSEEVSIDVAPEME
jgi:hypothetical protein